jgi:hypothetical protein
MIRDKIVVYYQIQRKHILRKNKMLLDAKVGGITTAIYMGKLLFVLLCKQILNSIPY